MFALVERLGHFFDRVLGWHTPLYEEGLTHDGTSFHACCRYCGKDIMEEQGMKENLKC